ncbi:hypothetical protein C8Q80DRAFT_1273469 [Daedaleopsis nitida]|nr:hypothetical protein C8Q80DRAFT_1273469 [Daedaleopsis nitida]
MSSETTPSTEQEWEQKLAQLRATNEELQRRRADAEKDRDLFRDLYGKASAHASAVSAENNELAERAALAEGQARDGVAMLKATYDERRDARMDDEIRRRAALEPELRVENEQLRGRLAALEEDYTRLEGLLEGMTRAQVEETSALESTVKNTILASVHA